MLSFKWEPLTIAAMFEVGPHLFTRCLHKSRKVNERILEKTSIFVQRYMDNVDILPGNQPTIKFYKNKWVSTRSVSQSMAKFLAAYINKIKQMLTKTRRKV